MTDTVSANSAPLATGLEAAAWALGLAGPDLANADLKRFPLTRPGRGGVTAKAGGTLITAAEITSGNGVMANFSGDVAAWGLPTMAQLGIVHDDNAPYIFQTQMLGTGKVYVNAAAYRGSVASQAAMLALVGVTPSDYCVRSDLGGQVWYLRSGGVATTLADWVSVPLNAANKPNPTGDTAAGVKIWDNGLAPHTLPSKTAPQTFVSCGLDQWYIG